MPPLFGTGCRMSMRRLSLREQTETVVVHASSESNADGPSLPTHYAYFGRSLAISCHIFT
jgi:hypothetical protein